jgi:DNA-directed RNA polymerase specialized sigma24 family protein
MGPDDAHSKGGFPSTRYSAIERIRDVDPDARRAAFGDLVEGYWKPVYKHLRLTWRLDPEDARDFTQGFFADAFQKAWLEKYEPEKARFRTFVRVCADRFVMNMRQSASRLKRGGGAQALSLDFESVEREVSTRRSTTVPEPDEFFHHEFVRALFDRAVQSVRVEYHASGRQVHFALFERYDLAESDGVSYADLAREFNLSPTQVTNYLAQVRRRFRERALEALRGLSGSDAEYRREARELFGLEVE